MRTYIVVAVGLALQSRSVRASTMRVRCDFGVKDTRSTLVRDLLVRDILALHKLAAYAHLRCAYAASLRNGWTIRTCAGPNRPNRPNLVICVQNIKDPRDPSGLL